jgi:hypothetical protein
MHETHHGIRTNDGTHWAFKTWKISQLSRLRQQRRAGLPQSKALIARQM